MSKNFYGAPCTFKDLLGKDGIYYEVPAYQRDYAWDESNWDSLWEDIVTSKEEHFMGFIILKKKTDVSFEIIDGQQRMATGIILLAACIKYFEQLILKIDPSKQGVEITRKDKLKSYYFFNSESKENEIVQVQKIHLNRTNNRIFSWILEHPSDVIQSNKETKSSQRIISAFNFFYDKIMNRFSKEKSGFKLFEFIEKRIVNTLYFTTLTVQNDEDAYVLFETLNSRGIQLAQADLLKNRLFSKMSDRTLKQAITKWDALGEYINKEEITTLVRWDWCMRKPRVTEKKLFHAIIPEITSSSRAMDYLNHLLVTARNYHVISNPKDYQLSNKQGYKQAVDLLNYLDILGNKIPMPLLLIAYQKLDAKYFVSLCRYLEVILFRYSIIGRKDLKPLEQKINEIATYIYSNKIDFRVISNMLKTIYLSDREFKESFSLKGPIKKKVLIRYILNRLNNKKENLNLNIEHILDIKPKDKTLFAEFSEKDRDQNIHRLGNIMLLNANINGSLTGKNFPSKKIAYEQDSETKDLFTTKSVLKYTKWTPSNLQKRQEEMAELACKVWAIKGW